MYRFHHVARQIKWFPSVSRAPTTVFHRDIVHPVTVNQPPTDIDVVEEVEDMFEEHLFDVYGVVTRFHDLEIKEPTLGSRLNFSSNTSV